MAKAKPKSRSKSKRGQSALQKARGLRRPGEGATVPVVKRLSPNPDGTTTMEIGIDFAQAPVPERRYLADMAFVTWDGTYVRLMLGQRRVAQNELRSLVVLSIAPDALLSFVRTCERFGPSLRGAVDRSATPRVELTPVEREPEHTISVAANVIAAAFAAREGSMDFYHASPWGLRGVHEREDLPLDPILRADMSIGLMVCIVDRLEEITAELPAEALEVS